MANIAELEAKFWKALKADRTMMLGLAGVDDGHTRPMTAAFEDDQAPLWFFTDTENAMARRLQVGADAPGRAGAMHGARATAAFVAKDHEVFAAVHGSLSIDRDEATIDRLWNPHIAAWYEGGREDPSLVLLRLDAESAEIWLNESSLFAGAKRLFGSDPKVDYKSKTGEVQFS